VSAARTPSIHTSATPPISSAADAEQIGCHHHRPAREPIGDHAADEDARHQRGGARRQNQADGRGRAAHLEHRERERDGDHPVTQHRDALRAQDESDVAQPEDRRRTCAACHRRRTLLIRDGRMAGYC
jgi:hypothetical protein